MDGDGVMRKSGCKMAFSVRPSLFDALPDQWRARCSFWGDSVNELFLYSNFVIAPAPSKDLVQICVKQDEIITRHIPLMLPSRVTTASMMPVEEKCTYTQFLDNTLNADDVSVRSIVKSTFGTEEVVYLDRLLNGHIDYLSRISPDLIVAILQHVELPDILNILTVNKKFNQICSNSEELWFKLYKKEISAHIDADMKMISSNCGWKACFKLYYKKGMKATEKVNSPPMRTKRQRSIISNLSVIGGPSSTHSPHPTQSISSTSSRTRK